MITSFYYLISRKNDERSLLPPTQPSSSSSTLSFLLTHTHALVVNKLSIRIICIWNPNEQQGLSLPHLLNPFTSHHPPSIDSIFFVRLREIGKRRVDALNRNLGNEGGGASLLLYSLPQEEENFASLPLLRRPLPLPAHTQGEREHLGIRRVESRESLSLSSSFGWLVYVPFFHSIMYEWQFVFEPSSKQIGSEREMPSQLFMLMMMMQ